MEVVKGNSPARITCSRNGQTSIELTNEGHCMLIVDGEKDQIVLTFTAIGD
jgi:uncharacterized protein (UPF0218 family)